MDKDWDSLDLKELENQMVELVDTSNYVEMLKIQLSELEMLQSMFSNPGEFFIDDYSVVADINDFVDGKTTIIPPRLDFTINLILESYKFEVCVNLPLEYPTLEPDVYIRSEKLSRHQQHSLNLNVVKFISNLDRGEICVGSVIQWLQEIARDYLDHVEPTINNSSVHNGDSVEDTFTRYWIYSHHIYSKIKRREILDLSHEYNITGFCLPGRPGIICIEGLESECEEFWQKVKCMNWKKIMCKKKESSNIDNNNIESLRKFPMFKEISFEGNKTKSRDYHMDFGEFYKYLVEYNCDYIFKEFFGVDGKQTTSMH